MYNTTKIIRRFSGLTLDQNWSTTGRLVLMVFLVCFGSWTNGCFVAAFFIEPNLRKSNIYLACTGLADFMSSSLVMSISAIVILSGQWDDMFVCKSTEIFGKTCIYEYILCSFFVSIEIYYKISHVTSEERTFCSMETGLISVFLAVVSFILAFIGVVFNYDYDYCGRASIGNIAFRASTGLMFQFIPALMTVSYLYAAKRVAARRAQLVPHYRRSQHYQTDSLASINMTVYIIFVLSWVPCLIIVYEFPHASDSVYYYSAWLGMLRSVFSSAIYAVKHPSFRRAYAHLFYYCCCKNRLPGSCNNRPRRDVHAIRPVRLHLRHQALVRSSPNRFTEETSL